MEETLLFLARRLVSRPDEVSVVRSERDDAVLFELRVAPDDVGRVIGKGGRTVRSLRVLVRASGAKSGERRLLEIVG
ncbi:MAG: KH domain-containing protein [Thermoleophilia bacterium]|nr:KH domain-containing protein [Thermoleophilia bacterium]